MRRIAIILSLLLAAGPSLQAQSSLDEIYSDIEVTGGICYPYHYVPSVPTPVPHGYKPVYISHFGRHGSRYQTWGELYPMTLRMFQYADSLGILSPKGKELLPVIADIAEDARDRTGDLSQRGLREHRGIARRMYGNFKSLLGKKNVRVRAYSTNVHRTILSMSAFIESLSKCNTTAQFTVTASAREQKYLNHAPNAAKIKRQFQSYVNEYGKTLDSPPDRLMGILLNDPDYVGKNPGWCGGVFGMLMQLALIMPPQDNPAASELLSLFTKEELHSNWLRDNYRLYMECGPSKEFGKLVTSDAIPLLSNIIETADKCLSGEGEDVTIRFGHDLNFVPLVSLLNVNGLDVAVDDPSVLYKVWSSYKISPMGTNLQLIFFRNPAGNVKVKVMLNEKECSFPEISSQSGPYYDWTILRAYLMGRISKYGEYAAS